jgi:phosphopentomutase
MPGVVPQPDACAAWGRLAEASEGKDTVTGHWEMMGVVTRPGFPLYPQGFPEEMLAPLGGHLGNYAASGTEILKQLGARHYETHLPIVYTSADSVLQIAAHEDPHVFGLEKLNALCQQMRQRSTICRVIARPFVGTPTTGFTRTENRRDYPLPPPHETVLDLLVRAGKRVHLIGKTCELFPTTENVTRTPTTNNPAHCAALTEAVQSDDAEFVFANLEDFDMLYGHRNDPVGFARLLREFDAWLGASFLPHLRAGDIVGITADHGNDPTTPSTDHSREYVPLLLFGNALTRSINLGTRATFADWGATVCEYLSAPTPRHGTSFLTEVL